MKYKKTDFNLNWNQAKKKYPKLKPYGDVDLDGTLNKRDCKPFDASKDGLFGRALGVITGGKYGQTKQQYQSEKLAKRIARRNDQKIISPTRTKFKRIYKQIPGRRLLEKTTQAIQNQKVITRRKNVYTIGRGITFRPSGSNRGGKGAGIATRTGKVGRPKGSYTYRNPLTGKPMHVWAYRKLVGALKRQNKAIAERRDLMEQVKLAKRGIPPEQAKVLVDARQIRQAIQTPVSTGNEGVQEQEITVPQQEINTIPQQQEVNTIQAEAQRIQTQVQPWQRRAAMNRLRRQQHIAQMEQQQNIPQQRMEVSLLDGRVRPKDVTANQRREKWTYS